MKYTVPLVFFYFFTMSLVAQDRAPMTAIFGKISQADYEFKTYDKDPNVAAVVLYESGNYTFQEIGNYIRLVKTVHRKIKVLDASKLNDASFSIPYYHYKGSSEKVVKIEAFTHNGLTSVPIAKEDIFTVDDTENRARKKFTFPAIEDGSILEYQYRLESPYFFNFGDWQFQNEYPTLYSEIRGDLPANYIYARSITGTQPLDVEISEIKKDCLVIDAINSTADCDSFVYGMYDTPAFEQEPFMLSSNNYISKISFEFQQATNLRGETTNFSKTWEDVDKEFKNEKDVGKQLKVTSFFKNQLSPELLGSSDELQKAKDIYKFIQNHFSWNGKYRIFSEIRVKEAFKERTANLAEINIALVNSLKSAGLDARLALGTLRQTGLLSDLYPTLTEFDYMVAHLTIGNTIYLLDATDRDVPFGTLPFKGLNRRVRVMDFDKGSYWYNIVPPKRNVDYYKIDLTLKTDFQATGTLSEIHSGYRAIDYRKMIEKDKVENVHKSTTMIDFQLEDTKLESRDESNNKPVKIFHNVVFDSNKAVDSLYFYPLSLDFERLTNPFENQKRTYPIDIGYPTSSTYDFTLKIPQGFTIVEAPSSKLYKFMGDAGSCSFTYTMKESEIQCLVRFALSQYTFTPEQYPTLREFFQGIADEHRTAVIKIKKG